jgi:hypothetical protein
MLLSEIALPVPYDECKNLALVYPYEVAVLWYYIQVEYGDPRHVAAGQHLQDGRWMMGGHLLSELKPDGILGWALPHLTPEIMAAVEIVPASTLPPPVPVLGPT